MGVEIIIAIRPFDRFQMLAILIKVPEFPPRDIGVMRMGETDGQRPGAFIMAARKLVQFLHSEIRDLVVIFHLVGNLGHASTRHRAHVVVPPVDALAGFAVIRRPAEIGGIDVGRQAELNSAALS